MELRVSPSSTDLVSEFLSRLIFPTVNRFADVSGQLHRETTVEGQVGQLDALEHAPWQLCWAETVEYKVEEVLKLASVG